MHFSERVLADAKDREAWLDARIGKVGASDAAMFAKPKSVNKYVKAKMMPIFLPKNPNSPLNWGNDREPIILADHGYEQNTIMFHSEAERRFEATPDGIRGDRLAQVKTTWKPFKTIPYAYRRQVWWEQFVMGPEFQQTDFIYEVYFRDGDTFIPEFESTVVKIDRDEKEIAAMVNIAYDVIRQLDLAVF